jgi:hypothetical protein
LHLNILAIKKSTSKTLNNWGHEVIENKDDEAGQYVKYIVYYLVKSILLVVSMFK